MAAMADGTWVRQAANLLVDMGRSLDAGRTNHGQWPWIHLVNLYLLTSILYYEYGHTFMSDSAFDQLCQYILKRIEKAKQNVWYPSLLAEEGLEAGTGYHLRGRYPMAIKRIAADIANPRQRKK